MAILGPVVKQHQDLCVGNRVGENIEQRLGLAVHPVQVLEDQNQRLGKAFTQQQALDRVQGAAPAYLPVHLGQRSGILFDAEQGEQIGQGVLKNVFQHHHLAGDFLAAAARVVVRCDAGVAVEQLYHRQVGRGL